MSVFEPKILEATSEEAGAEARKAIEPTVPLMPMLPADTTALPGGFIDSDGVLHTECRIREINGADEEAMARELRSPTVNVPKVVDLLLKRCVLSVGLIDPVPPGVLSKMLTGDRAALILAIRILTFGTDWEVPDFPCKLCGQTFGCIVELESIPLK